MNTIHAIFSKQSILPFLLCIICACASTNQQVTEVEMDPMAFRAVRGPDGAIRVQSEDLGESYSKAEKALDAAEYEKAADLFASVADMIPDDIMGRAARYNAGFCFESAKKHANAIQQYLLSLKSPPEQRTDSQIRIRIAYQYLSLEKWQDVESILQPVTARQVPNIQRLEVNTLIGLAYKGQNLRKDGERWLREAADFWRRHQKDELVRNSIVISQALYGIAEILRQYFLEQPLRLPLDRMKEDLKEKSTLFGNAQEAYLDVVRQKDLSYKIKAGHAIGVMYEEFYDDLLKAEIPQDLDEEDRALYFLELRRKIRVFLFKAGSIYKTTLERAGLSRKQFKAGEQTAMALRSVQSRICVDLSCPDANSECYEKAKESCGIWFSQAPAKTTPEWLNGVWEEQWPDRECEDMSIITAGQDSLSLSMSSCTDGRHYIISKLVRDESTLRFDRAKPNEKAWSYELKRDGTILVGIAKRGAQRHAVHWKRARRVPSEGSHAQR